VPSINSIADALRLSDDAMPWLEQLAALESPDLRLPSDAQADEQLDSLGVPALDRTELLASRPTRTHCPDRWWLLERAYRQLIDGMGTGGSPFAWPDLDESLGPAAGYLYPWVFLAALPAVLDFHAQRGIPESVSRVSLEDLGRQMTICRNRLGRGGLIRAEWLTLHFRGALYELGRLQYQRHRIRPEVARTVLPLVTEDLPALSVHIPARGPLTPELSAESFAMAGDFFGRHFPEHDYRYATCYSWLLDPQLAEYLPEDSNIMRFQRSFTPVPEAEPDAEPEPDSDAFVVALVFNQALVPGDGLDRLPQDTTLQRAIVAHLRAGRHWYFRPGWRELR
jgi:hypothetical protein